MSKRQTKSRGKRVDGLDVEAHKGIGTGRKGFFFFQRKFQAKYKDSFSWNYYKIT